MPLDVLGRTRATLSGPTGEDARERFPIPKSARAGDRGLQFSLLNEEYLVSVGHQPALNTSLPFVHTARRYYRLNVLVRSSAWFSEWLSGRSVYIEKMLKLDHLEEVKVVTRFP